MKETRIQVARETGENQANSVEHGTQGRMETESGNSYSVTENGE